MYIPDSYKDSDPRNTVKKYPFGTLINTHNGNIFATSTPIFFETDAPDEMALVGHFSRNNPHAKTILKDTEVLVIFTGPQAYISASWYKELPTVPTWNYVTTQVKGTIEPIDDPDGNIEILMRTAHCLELNTSRPWSLMQAPTGKVDSLLPRIRSFRIKITAINGAAKLSQTHPKEDRKRVIRALEKRQIYGDMGIAALMRQQDGIPQQKP